MTEYYLMLRGLMDTGKGRPTGKWTQAELAEEVGVSVKSVANWLKGDLPQQKHHDALARTFYPASNKQDQEGRQNFARAYRIARNHKPLQELPFEKAKSKQFSLNDVWSRVLNTKQGLFRTVIHGGDETARYGGFGAGQVKFENTGRRFFIAMPPKLVERVDSGLMTYDVHARHDEFDGGDLSYLAEVLPVPNLIARIRHFADVYADLVIRRWNESGSRPYNKLKYGVWAVVEGMAQGRQETPIAEIQLYVTDFFTNWVMSRIYEETSQQFRRFFYEMENYPTLQIDGADRHMPFFAPSLGLNCMLICKSETSGDQVCFTRLRNQSTFFVQHNKLHVALNEGLNVDDSEKDPTRHPTLDSLWKRMLDEELGIKDPSDFQFEALDIFLDNTVGEFGIFGVLTTDRHTPNGLSAQREKHARDAGREFRGPLIGVPLDPSSIMEFVMGEPQSINAFTSYAPQLVDLFLARTKIFT